MQDPHDQTATLIAIEHGATWPSWGNQVRDRGLNLVVEAQLPHESLADLHGRIAHRIAREKAAGMTLVAAGYVCSLSTRTPASADARLEICRLLLEELEYGGTQQSPSGESTRSESTDDESIYWSRPAQLILGSGGWKGSQAEPYARALLLDLWSTLSGLEPGKVVSLRFDEAPGESGSYPVTRQHQDAAPSVPPAGAGPRRGAKARPLGRTPQVHKSLGLPAQVLAALAAGGESEN
jgi:hypothetical protein